MTGVSGLEAELQVRANRVYELERSLAPLSEGLTSLALQQVTTGDFQQATGIPLVAYMTALDPTLAPTDTQVVTYSPTTKYVQQRQIVEAASMETLRDYLRWHLTIGLSGVHARTVPWYHWCHAAIMGRSEL